MTLPLGDGALGWIASGAVLLAGVLGVAVLLATLDWAMARAAHRAGWSEAPAGRLGEWTSGLGSLPTTPLGGGEPILVALGYGVVAAAATLAASLAARVLSGVPLPGGLGFFAFTPLLFAFGYHLAAQGAATPEAARRRILTGGRILLSTPAWAVTLAGWAAFAGVAGPWSAGETAPAWLRALLAAAILWSGLFVLPGSAGELGFASRAWGGDAHEGSRAVRAFTAWAHYAALAAVLGLAGAALGGGFRWDASLGLLTLAVAGGLAARRLAVFGPAARWVRTGAAALPGLLLAIVLVLWFFQREAA